MRLLFLITFLTISFFQSFSQTADLTEGCAPLTVKFNAPAGSNTYYWNFQDKVTSDKKDPVNIFLSAGTYNVTFQESVTGPVIKTITIKVFAEPILAVTSMQGCAPFIAQFKNTSTIDPGIKSPKFVWVFGDGQSAENINNPSHYYPQPGTFDISLNLQTQSVGCDITKIFTKALEVFQAPVARYNTDPASGTSCNEKADFGFVNQSTGTKPLTYSWNFGNTKTSAVENPGVQNYSSGQYKTSLTVSYADVPGCSSTMARTISVGSPKPDIIVRDTACLSNLVPVKTSVGGNHKWNFGPGASANNTTGDSALVVYTTAGKHTISLVLTSPDGNCSGTASKEIFLQDLDLKIETDQVFGCNNPKLVKYKAVSSVTDLSYKWTFADKSKGEGRTIEKLYWTDTDSIYYDRNIREVHVVNLEVTSKSSQCSASKISRDTLWLPNAIFSPTVTKGCAPVTTTFSDSSLSAPNNPIVKWRWLMGDGTIIDQNNNKTPLNYSYKNPGKYQARLLVTTKLGCTDTSFAVLIEVGTDVSSQLNFSTSKTEVCLHEQVDFTASIPASLNDKISAYHFSTEGNRLSHCFNEKQASWTYTQEAGPQAVSLSVDYNGCFSTIEKPAFVNVKGAVAKIEYASSCNTPLNYAFRSTGQNANKVSWVISDATEYDAKDFNHTFAKTGEYSVRLNAEDPSSGCAATMDRVILHPRTIKASIKMDTLLCIGGNYTFNAGASVDVLANCHTGYTWQFPGIDKRPFTTDAASATFNFQQAGVHKVLLIVKDINGCKDTAAKFFKVYKMELKASLDDVDKKICTPALVSFTDQSTGDTTLTHWFWNFGDNTTSTEKNPKHNFIKPPSSGNKFYDVSLYVKDSLGCSDTLKVPLQYYKPISAISATPSPNLCLGKSVTLKAADYLQGGSKLTYLWNFGNNKIDSLQENIIIYDSAKTYTAKLLFKESGSNCKGDTSIIIRVQDYPVAGMTTNVDTIPVLCAPQNVFFKDASVSRFPLTSFWDFGNKQTSTAMDFTLFYPKGTFKATHIVTTSYGCKDTVTQSFKVYRPEGNFSMDKNLICKGDVITFQIKDTIDVGSFTWAFGDGSSVDGISPVSHKYNFHPPSGQTLAKMVLRGVQGICPVDVELPVNIRRVIADFERNNGGDTSICFNDGPYPIKDKSVAIQNYMWDFGDGKTSTIANPVTHAYETPGVYKVKLSGSDNTTGCKDTIVKDIVIYKNPKLQVTGDTVCQGTPVQFRVLGADTTSTYLWTPATGLSSTSAINPIANLEHTVHYQLSQTDMNGCSDNKEVPAIVIEPINLHDWDTTLIIGDSARLPVNGQNVYKFQWTPQIWLSCLDCNYPWARPLVDTTYKLKVTDVRNCFSNAYEFAIKIKPETFIRMPTTFSPNEDHNNDSVYVQGWGIKQLLEFQIFNRWGQMIYASDNLKLGWDGKYNGVIQNSDVYVYKVKVLTWREEILYNEGYINLIH